jgi:hypothetical protein
MADRKRILWASQNVFYTEGLIDVIKDEVNFDFDNARNVGEAVNMINSQKYAHLLITDLWLSTGPNFELKQEDKVFGYGPDGGLYIIKHAVEKGLSCVVAACDLPKGALKKAREFGAREVIEAPTYPSNVLDAIKRADWI